MEREMELEKNIAVKIEHVSKWFGKRKVVDDLSLETYEGEVFGFLGPNGAGKTTTIKMAVGLIGIDEGHIEICGADVEKKFEKAMANVGGIVENPEMYKYMTGLNNLKQYARMRKGVTPERIREVVKFEKAMANVGGIVENPEMYKYMTGLNNLKQYARMRKGVTPERIREVVELVGLTNRINEKISRYSLGMRQRLGVAQALLHHPKVLILDEPTNGLDPAGIRSLRDILRTIAHKEQICVIVSSHLMSEMQLMCDRVGIIVNGKLIRVTSVEELVQGEHITGGRYRYHISDSEKASQIIGGFQNASVIETKLIRVTSVEELVQGEHITGGRYRYHISDSEKASQIIGGFQNASVIETDPNHLEILLEAGNEQILSEINRKLVLNGIELYSQIIGGFQNASVIETDPNHLEILLEAGNEQILSEINRKLVLNGIELYTVAPIEGQKLEDAFIELTKGDGQIA